MIRPRFLSAQEVALWSLEHRTVRSSTGCLLWLGAKVRGYGRLGFRGKQHQAHRFIKAALEGPPPSAGMEAAHQCHTPACVRPDCVEWQWPRQNVLDVASRAPTAVNARKLSCPRCGQEFVRRRSRRVCLSCKYAYDRRWLANKRVTSSHEGALR